MVQAKGATVKASAIGIGPVLLFGLGAALLVRLTLRSVNRGRAERKLQGILKRDYKQLFISDIAERLGRERLDLVDFVRARKILAAKIGQLGDKEQKNLWPGLIQSSLRGQANYVARLFKGASKPVRQSVRMGARKPPGLDVRNGLKTYLR